MQFKSAATHALTFSLGLLTGVLLASKCPPTPAPAGQPAKDEPKIEAKKEPEAKFVVPAKTETKVEAKTETKADAKPEVQ